MRSTKEKEEKEKKKEEEEEAKEEEERAASRWVSMWQGEIWGTLTGLKRSGAKASV